MPAAPPRIFVSAGEPSGDLHGGGVVTALRETVPGAAITWIRIGGALHEFATIPGVREDTTELILNLKDLAIKVHTNGSPEALSSEIGKLTFSPTFRAGSAGSIAINQSEQVAPSPVSASSTCSRVLPILR